MATRIAPPPPPPPPGPPGGSSNSSSQQQQQQRRSVEQQQQSQPSNFVDISQLPSLKDGMSMEEESTKRRKTCRFIEEAGRILKLPRVAVSTAMVFFHRFYAKHSFITHDRFEVAVATLVLAAKTEESPKKLNSVLLECHKLKQRGMQAGRISQQKNSAGGGSGGSAGGPGSTPPGSSSPKSNGGNTPSSSSSTGTLDTKGEEFAKLKERILLLERVILHTIGFELSIDHPYKYVVEQIKKLIHTRQLKYNISSIKNPKKQSQLKSLSSSQIMPKMMEELVQYAMSFANDSMHTSLCLQFSSQQIAIACIYLAGQFAHVQPVINSSSSTSSSSSSSVSTTVLLDAWSKVLGRPNIEAHASICLQVMELIYDRKASDTDSFKKIRAQIELWKQRAEEHEQRQQQQQQKQDSSSGAAKANDTTTTVDLSAGGSATEGGSSATNKRSASSTTTAPPPPPPGKKAPPPPPPGGPPTKRPRPS